MKVALYARVSKALEQNPENQLIELRRWASAASHEVIGEFVDEVSSKDTRPEKEHVLKLLRVGVAEGVAFWSLDRWARNMGEIILELEEFGENRTLVSLKEGIDYRTAVGKLHAHILAAFANFERERIRERTLLGLARARAQGKRLGRPRKTPPANLKDFPVGEEDFDKTDVFPKDAQTADVTQIYKGVSDYKNET